MNRRRESPFLLPPSYPLQLFCSPIEASHPLEWFWYGSASSATCTTQPISPLHLNVRKRAEKVRSATKNPPLHLICPPGHHCALSTSEASQHLASPSSTNLTAPCANNHPITFCADTCGLKSKCKKKPSCHFHDNSFALEPFCLQFTRLHFNV